MIVVCYYFGEKPPVVVKYSGNIVDMKLSHKMRKIGLLMAMRFYSGKKIMAVHNFNYLTRTK